MSYTNLRQSCSDLSIPVSRATIKERLLSETGKEKLAICASGNITSEVCRGLFFSIESDTIWAAQNGSDVVVLARDMLKGSPTCNRCMERFVTVKEMMHLFDTEAEYCDTGAEFDNLIDQFQLTTSERTEAFNSEIACFWRALALLCPENERLVFKEQKESGTIDDYGIALKLRIPEQYVHNLFKEGYEVFIERL